MIVQTRPLISTAVQVDMTLFDETIYKEHFFVSYNPLPSTGIPVPIHCGGSIGVLHLEQWHLFTQYFTVATPTEVSSVRV